MRTRLRAETSRTAAAALLGGLLMAWTAPAGAGPLTPAAPASTATVTDLGSLMRRIQEAGQKQNYAGTYVTSSGGTLSSSRITHYCDGREQIERIEALDGQMRRVFRHNDTIHVLWPARRSALIEQRDVAGRFPQPLQPDDTGRLSESYDLVPEADDRVAGLDAQVLVLRPRDALRYARRLWLERRTGLLLRSDLLGERGEVLESTAFSELQIGAKLHPQALLQEMNQLEGYQVSRPVYQPTDLAAEGWGLRQAIAGFSSQRVLRRPIAPWPTQRPAGAASAVSQAVESPATGQPMVLQAVYSDGLTHVSLFIEPHVAGVPRRETPATVGSTSALSRRIGDWWVTAVGAVPPAALQQFTASLERRRAP
ncbi:MAG: hypothetical protein RLZZ592_320 [Pseudomonadota bacterium]|jgi:sigma-E factor negative regulatory protein RseB|nr:sigma-E factor negative regulatory protein RseB [Pseudomonadota bacterium]